MSLPISLGLFQPLSTTTPLVNYPARAWTLPIFTLRSFGFDVLIVHALDRLARDPYIRQTLEREFNERGARVEFVLGAYEETPEGEVRKDLDATFAKWENAKRVERCMRGKRRKAEGGKWVAGIAPLGYQLDPDGKGGLTIVPEQAEMCPENFLPVYRGTTFHSRDCSDL